MKYYIIAGEPSGDLHASNLMRALAKRDADAEFRFWGGDLMSEALGEIGCKGDYSGLVCHYRDTAVMGVWDVLTHLNKIRRNFNTCYADLTANRPDVLILVDYAGFNLPVAKFAHKRGIRVFYYIAPKTWASKEHRVKDLKAYVDRIFTIMPFETEHFAKHGIDVVYCGNPIMDAITNRHHAYESFTEFCQRNNLDERPMIALVAGSRKSELKYNLPVMLKTVEQMPGYQFVIAGAPSFTAADYEPYLQNCPSSVRANVNVIFGETYQLMSQARAALVTSGTATLETAVLNCPQVVVYLMWGGWFSDFVAHLFIKVPFISLVNLILGREAVVELFQRAYSFDRMLSLLRKLAGESHERDRMLGDYAELRRIVGGSGCSDNAAEAMLSELKKQ